MKKCITKILAVLMTVLLLASVFTIGASAQVTIKNAFKRSTGDTHRYISGLCGIKAPTSTDLTSLGISRGIKKSSDYYAVDPNRKSGSSYEADIHYGSSKDPMAFGFQFTQEATSAITYIYASVGEEKHLDIFQREINSTSVTMSLVGGWIKARDIVTGEYEQNYYDEINLNENTDDDNLFLYVSRDASLGQPVTQIFLDIRTDALTDYTGTDKTYVRDQNGAIADLNAGASNHVYMYYLTTAYEPLAGSVFADTGIIYTIIGAVIFAGAITGVIIITKKKKKN